MTSTRPPWAIVVPVKRLGEAKTRLRTDEGLRREIALAIALDTVRAALACPAVAVVVAVSDDEVAGPALTRIGAVVVPDIPDAGLNPALQHGARHAALLVPGARVATVSADLPALAGRELAALLAHAAEEETAFVADASGEGTTVLTARTPELLRPAYGARSRRAHLDAGAVDLTDVAGPTLRQDVDTLADLAAAAELGCGSDTADLLARHPDLLTPTRG
jgi:2-phospho-L-lactate guanylyltransferase